MLNKKWKLLSSLFNHDWPIQLPGKKFFKVWILLKHFPSDQRNILYWFGRKIVSCFFNIHVWKKFVHFCRGICAFKKWYLGGFLNFNIFVKNSFLRKSSFNLMFCTLCILIQLIKSNVDHSFHMSFSKLIYWIIISNF